LEVNPCAVTMMVPEVASSGTVTAICAFDQLEIEAVAPPIETLPGLKPNPVPLMVSTVPIGPLVGVTPEMIGPGRLTVKFIALLAMVLTVTTT
jgi:hypothetical protein